MFRVLLLSLCKSTSFYFDIISPRAHCLPWMAAFLWHYKQTKSKANPAIAMANPAISKIDFGCCFWVAVLWAWEFFVQSPATLKRHSVEGDHIKWQMPDISKAVQTDTPQSALAQFQWEQAFEIALSGEFRRKQKAHEVWISHTITSSK